MRMITITRRAQYRIRQGMKAIEYGILRNRLDRQVLGSRKQVSLREDPLLTVERFIQASGTSKQRRLLRSLKEAMERQRVPASEEPVEQTVTI